MLDYTDIASKLEEVRNALNSLCELAVSQYDGVFQGEDVEKYQRMLYIFKVADIYLSEANEINDRLSDVFGDKLRDTYG